MWITQNALTYAETILKLGQTSSEEATTFARTSRPILTTNAVKIAQTLSLSHILIGLTTTVRATANAVHHVSEGMVEWEVVVAEALEDAIQASADMVDGVDAEEVSVVADSAATVDMEATMVLTEDAVVDSAHSPAAIEIFLFYK